jgi:hypothetical protein
MEEIDVKMKHVEVVCIASYAFEHRKVEREVALERLRIEAYGAIACRDQPAFGLGIAGGEERDVMAQFHQCVDEMGDDAFGPAIKRGRDGLVKWSNLGNLHVVG